MSEWCVGVRKGAPWCFFVALALGLCAHAMPSADLWWQLSGGREMVEGGTFPRQDRYSFSAAGELWLNHEWLAECVMYLVYTGWGTGALHLAKSMLILAAFGLVGVVAARDVSRPWAVALACSLALVNSEWRSFYDVRPYLLTYVLLGATWVVADGALRSKRWPSLVTLFPIFLVWANVHSGVVAGLGLLGVVALVDWRSGGKTLLAFTVGCAVAASVNPYGVEVLTYPFQFLGTEDDWTRFLNEWARPEWTGAQASFTVFVVFTGVAWLLGRRRIPMRHGWVLLAFLVLASRAWRNLPLFALVSVPVWAACLAVCWEGVEQWSCRRVHSVHSITSARAWSALTCGVSLGVVAVSVGLAAWGLVRTEWSALSMEREMFPATAVRFLKANPLPKRLLNPYGWGGYLAFHLCPEYFVFMDGRASTVYPERVYHDFLVATQGVDAPGVGRWQEVLARYGVHAVVVNRWESLHQKHTVGRVLPASPGWKCVYADAVTKIYVDSSPEGLVVQELARKRQLRFPEGARNLAAWPIAVLLDDAKEALSAGQLSEARELLDLACGRDPAPAAAWFLSAVVAVRTGDVARGEELTRRALSLDPLLPEAHFNLAVLLRLRGDVDGARREVEMELKVNPNSVPAQGLLDELRRRD